jgi:exonuclease SbcC
MYQLKSLQIANIISFKNQTFEFRNGKAILIVGQNLDDSSQNGNGSGKSSLIEAIALAFTGSSIRDVKTKELIHAGEDSGEVTLTLFNTVSGKEFKIWRKIYANTKSGEYAAWIDGKEQSDRYSDANMFNSFVWDTIGISKEDFFSFFLITKENYTPFLLVGDSKKKEIINRFSGADKVDNALPAVENDSELIAKEICDIEKELTQNQTRQEVLAEQLLEEENGASEEIHQQAIQAKEQALEEQYQDSIVISHNIAEEKKVLEQAKKNVVLWNCEKDEYLAPFLTMIDYAESEVSDFDTQLGKVIQPYRDAVEIAELEVETFEFTKDYETEFSNLANTKRHINREILAKKQEIPKIKDQFSDESNAIDAEEKELKESLADAENELKENERFESEVTKQLQDVIECPNCHHKFNLRDKSFNYEEAVKQLPEVQQAISEYKELILELKNQINIEIQAKRQELNNMILKAGEGIKNEIEALNKGLVDLGNQELELKKQQREELNNKQILIDNVAKAKRELDNKLSEGVANRKGLLNKVQAAKNDLSNAEMKYQAELTSLQNVVRKHELSIQQFERELKGKEEAISLLQDQIDKLKAQKIDRSKIDKLTADIEALVKAEEAIKIRLDEKRKEKESVDAWEIHFKNFKSHLANKSIKNIEDYTNLFLNSMGSNLAIKIDGYKTLASKKVKEQISTSVLRDGFDSGSYGKFSGGERGRIDICNIVGMQELISLNAGHGKGLDMLLADEILESVDVQGMECIINSLQSLGKTIMLVSQNEINTLAEYTLTIQKKNKVSTILN